MEEDDAFSKYLISNEWKLLDNIKERTSCPKCSKSRKYFCYTCYIPVSSVKSIIPQVSVRKCNNFSNNLEVAHVLVIG